jgi:hypothetical protein
MKFKQATQLPLVLTIAGVLLNMSCFNNGDFYSGSITPLGRPGPSTTPTGIATSTGSAKTIYLSQVTVEGGTSQTTSGAQPTPGPSSNSSSTTAPNIVINLDTTRSTLPLTEVCSVGQSVNGAAAKPCLCQFSWYEANQTTGVNIQIPRLVTTAPTIVQPYVAVCKAPDVWDLEITADRQIKLKLIPTQGNAELFDSNEVTFTKPTVVSRGSFRDARGRSFSNIMRYSCYETNRRGTQIKTKIFSNTVSGGGDSVNVKIPLASKFCVRKDGDSGSGSSGSAGTGSGSGDDDCTGLDPIQNSSQANYFNFYIRESERGDVIGSNNRYVCPKVKEGILPSAGAANIGQPYPLDATFSLALDRSADFSVGVEAFTKLSNGNDPIAASSSCSSGTTTTDGDSSGSSSSSGTSPSSSTGSRISSCLGFAAKVNPDHTCPVYRDEFGNNQPTFRLRRFVAVYPPFYPADGKISAGSGSGGDSSGSSGGSTGTGAQDVDTIYVVDRPVRMPGDANPNKPYTMRGPKPCPFAYFDAKGVANGTSAFYPQGMPGYVATNNPLWSGTNVDGIEFPNRDLPASHPQGPSCSAAMPVYNPLTNILSIATVNERNPAFKKLYVRPIQAWSPHYEEDLEFEACAPLANPLRDPPLHFARDTASGNVAYCAEVYPTQNENVAAIDRPADPTQSPSTTNAYVGRVAPFNSHVVKNSASARCTATRPSTLSSISSFYPAASTAACSYNPSAIGVTGFAYHPSNLWIDQDNNLTTVDKSVCAANTCDRTVMSPSFDWPTFPLLARPNMVESAIARDSTFGCVVTYDGNGPKQGVSTPSEGCCGSSVQMWTGLTTATTTDQRILNMSAHLEPDVQCLSPKY